VKRVVVVAAAAGTVAGDAVEVLRMPAATAVARQVAVVVVSLAFEAALALHIVVEVLAERSMVGG